MRRIEILGTGKYLPQGQVSAEDLDEKLQLKPGWTLKKSGVRTRYYVGDETVSYMGAKAARQAIEHAAIKSEDIDCIISASATMEQIIPCTASLIQKELQLEGSGIPCFDMNSTCLSFVTAFDMASCMIAQGMYNNILIVSSEIASVGLNWDDPHSCILFGDGAAAAVIGSSQTNKILASKMKTYSSGSELAEIKGGGSKLHSKVYTEDNKHSFLFKMDGLKIYKLTSKLLPQLVNELLKDAKCEIDDIDMVIPHQASLLAMQLTQKNLNIPDNKFMYIIENHGNTIAASIPMALHEAISQNKIKRGSKIMLLGTSAGVSLGGMIFEY